MKKWNTQDKEKLLNFKNDIDSDNIKIKEQIKQTLLGNEFIIHVLDNKELEENDSEPDEYFGVNIYPYYLIPDIQHAVNNYICYDVGYTELNRYNSTVKKIQVTFNILCREEGIIDLDTGVAKHDLLAALIQDQFNYVMLGNIRLQLVSDSPSTTDTHYLVRTLVFEHVTDNNLVKTRSIADTRTPILANKVMMYESEQVRV